MTSLPASLYKVSKLLNTFSITKASTSITVISRQNACTASFNPASMPSSPSASERSTAKKEAVAPNTACELRWTTRSRPCFPSHLRHVERWVTSRRVPYSSYLDESQLDRPWQQDGRVHVLDVDPASSTPFLAVGCVIKVVRDMLSKQHAFVVDREPEGRAVCGHVD